MSYYTLLRDNRDFRKLYAALLISLCGDWFLTVALLDLVLELSGSAALASLMIVAQALPVFFISPFAGPLIDRFDRKVLMVAIDLLRIGAALLPLLATTQATLWLAFAGAIGVTLGAGIFNPAAHAALPNLVSAEELPHANVLQGAAWGAMLAVGAAIGGVVTMTLGRETAFVIDAATFLVSAGLVLSIRRPFSEEREPDLVRPALHEALRETVQYARQNPKVFALLTSKGAYGIGAGVVAMLSVFGRDVFQAGARGIGFLFAARGIGALLGPFVVNVISRSDRERYRMIWASMLLFGIGYMALAFSPALLVGVLFTCIAHMGGGAQWVTSNYGLQKEVPDRIRGRVFAADYGLVTLTMSVSSILTGVAADAFGAVTATALTSGVAIVWAGAWGWLTRKLW